MSQHLKGLISVIVLAGVLWLLWSQYDEFLERGQRPTEGTQKLNVFEKEGVPGFTLKDLSGKEVSLSDFKGKAVIVNFWASWCDPCVEEFPSMIKLVKHFKGEVVIIAISADNTKEDIEDFLKAFKAYDPSLVVLWDKEQLVAKKFGTAVLPESYILGKNNRFIRKIAGIDDWYSPQAINFFEELIKGNVE